MTGFKKFWVLCLAAGMLFALSGISEAAIYLTANGEDRDSVELLPSEVCLIEIVSNDASAYFAFVGFESPPPGTFGHEETKPEAGTGPWVEPINEPGWFYGYWVETGDGPSGGVHFVFLYHAGDYGDVMLKLCDGDFYEVDSIYITTIRPWYGACCCGPGCCYMSDGSDCWDEWLGPGTNCSMCGATITITSPNGGESLVANTTYPITWSGDFVGDVLIKYSNDNGLHWNNIATVPNSGSYNWLVPVVNSNQCLVRVSVGTNTTISDTSDGVFTIEAYTISVTCPNGGECLLPNTNYTIKWSVKGSISDVLIEYSNDNGLNWNNIATVPNSGSYNWLVPGVNSNQCLVRVSDATNHIISDTSEGVFSIGMGLGRYSGGTGMPCNPYRIATAEDLNDVGNHEQDWDKCFILVNDVNLAEYTSNQFRIIGNSTRAFTGVFDGNDHKVWNFTWDSNDRDYVGLFGYVGSGTEIKKLGMENVNVKTKKIAVGGLVGMNDEGTIIDCYSTGSVTGGDCVGGLVGQNGDFYYEWISWELKWLGAVREDAWIHNCYSICTVSGTFNVGAGFLRSVGGLTGGSCGEITDSYSTGSVVGTGCVGGLVGANEGRVANCYSTGSVSGTGTQYAVGGLIGHNEFVLWGFIDAEGHWSEPMLAYGDSVNSFWDIQKSGEPNSDGGTPKTTTEMQTKITFTGADWDFVSETINGANDMWRMCVDGVRYPMLSWQFGVGDFTCPDGVDFIDFAVLASAWLSDPKGTEWKLVCDISEPKDSFIDDLDLVIFCDNWLEDTTP